MSLHSRPPNDPCALLPRNRTTVIVTKRKGAGPSPRVAERGSLAAKREADRIANIISYVGDELSAVVLLSLDSGPKRRSTLARELAGRSQRSLILTLQKLEGEGLIASTMFAGVPPRVEWDLTHRGRDLISARVS
jgi:DNA-binding HxlR family transcriptional regulator